MEVGGAQRLLSDLIPIQKEQGIDVAILVNEMSENELIKKITDIGVTVFTVNSTNFKSPLCISKIRNYIKNFEVVHVHLFPSLYWVALASIGLDVKLIYTEHSTSNRRRNRPYLRPIEKFIYNRYKKVVSISDQTQDALKKWLGLDEKKFIVINNGVDIQAFNIPVSKVKPKSLIMISRFVAAKDQECLIKAMSLLDNDVTLQLVGDGENLEYCRNLAIQEGVIDRIEFLGTRSDVGELISKSYIGVQSSNWEGFGLTAVEIMAAGKPVIASDVAGLRQVVEGAGILFPKGDYKTLAKKIKDLLYDEEKYRVVSSKCKIRSLSYDVKTMAESYRKLYSTSL